MNSKRDTIVACNIRSLNKNIQDLLISTQGKSAKVICLQETWLQLTEANLKSLDKAVCNQRNICIGRGKGISSIYKKEFDCKRTVNNEKFQMMKIESEKSK